MSDTATKADCRLIRSGSSYQGKQGFNYAHGISAETTGAMGICMHLLTIPPGGRAKAHLHESHETTIYVISGKGAMWYGHQLENHMLCEAGDMIYIPCGVPHLPYNPSETETSISVLARTDPNEQESVVLRPDLEHLVPASRA